MKKLNESGAKSSSRSVSFLRVSLMKGRFPAISVLLAGFFSVVSSGLALAQSDGIHSALSKRANPVPLVHPVLLVKANEPLGYKPLDSKVFKKLNGLLKMNRKYKVWDGAYEKAEWEVAGNFCEQVKGLKKKEIERLAGPPRSKGVDTPSLMATGKYGTENWVYIFGVTPLIVRLFFENDTCTSSSAAPYDMDEFYANWRLNEISKFAIGKTVPKILEAEGPPQDLSHSHLPENLSEQDKVKLLEKQLFGRKTLVYDVGYGQLVTLFLENGRCVDARETGSVFGARGFDVTFKMP